MTILSLNAGDNIHLPKTIIVNEKTHKLLIFDSFKSKQLKGCFLIQRDLSQIKSSIENHIKDSINDFEFFRALIITYRKLWKDSGSRYVKLEVSRDLKQATEKLLNLHYQLIQLGDKYIAHPDETEYDQSSILLIMEEEKAVGVFCPSMSLQNFDKNHYFIWLELIKFLENSINLLLEEKQKIVIDEYNSSLINKN